MPFKTPHLYVSSAFTLSALVLGACGQAQNASIPKNTEQQIAAQVVSQAAPVVKTAQAEVLDPFARGAKLYKRCKTCHTLNEGGRHKVGPNLWALYGSSAGTKEGFAYSKAMQASGLTWNRESLNGFLENPAKFLPKNRMTYVGLRKAEDRAALLDYLKAKTGVTLK